MKPSTRHRTRSRAPARRLSELAGKLPTREQVDQARSGLDELISVLRAFRKSLDAIPTSNSPRFGTTGRPGPVRAVNGGHGARELCELINSWL